MAVTQIPSSYQFIANYNDGGSENPLKIIVLDAGLNNVYENDALLTDTDITIDVGSAGFYTVYYYSFDGVNWNDLSDEPIQIFEYHINVDWSWDPGHANNEFVEGDVYTYMPFIILNNEPAVIPPSPVYTPQITFSRSELINGVWVQIGSSSTRNLSSWDDNAQDLPLISYQFTFGTNPTKINVVVSNSNEQLEYDTYLDDGLLFTVLNGTNIHSEIQNKASYSVTFNYNYQNEEGNHPSLVITPSNNTVASCGLYLYKNNNLIHSYENLSPTAFYTYEFAEPTQTLGAGVTYEVRYISTNSATGDSFTQIVPFSVGEYKPTFDLPTIQCKKINENTTIKLLNLRFNCFADEEYLHYTSPADFTPNINFKLYYLNPNTYTWEIQGLEAGYNTSALMTDVETLEVDPNNTDTDISFFLENKYRFGSTNLSFGIWAPNKLTMVKLVVEVTNYTTSVMKETIFPICGTWKIRRMSCGNYRIYNYTENTVPFTIGKLENQTFIVKQNINVAPFSFEVLDLPEDGTYEVYGASLYKYIFNFCSIENCILELQKKVLLDNDLCDACKLDKVLYQKALRVIPLYETWKKLLDRDWVYEIQYQSTDIDKNLSAIYDANELYLELKDICDNCNYSSKKCSCK